MNITGRFQTGLALALLPGASSVWAQNGKITPHLAISGRTMEFDGSATCVSGC